MRKTGLLALTLMLILFGVCIGEAQAQFPTTMSTTQTLLPGSRYINQNALRSIAANETVEIKVQKDIGLNFRFWIMNSSEFGNMETIGGYDPETQLNVSTTFYWNNSFVFRVAADYIYGVENEESLSIIVTIEITRDSAIDGFTTFWALFGLLALALIIYFYQNKSNKKNGLEIPNFLT